MSAVMAAAADEGVDFVLNARTDAFAMGRDRDPAEVLADAIERGKAFLDAGAPLVFVPGRLDEAQVTALVEAFGPQRLTVLGIPGGLSLARLEELGVARVSYGPMPYASGADRVARTGRGNPSGRRHSAHDATADLTEGRDVAREDHALLHSLRPIHPRRVQARPERAPRREVSSLPEPGTSQVPRPAARHAPAQPGRRRHAAGHRAQSDGDAFPSRARAGALRPSRHRLRQSPSRCDGLGDSPAVRIRVDRPVDLLPRARARSGRHPGHAGARPGPRSGRSGDHPGAVATQWTDRGGSRGRRRRTHTSVRAARPRPDGTATTSSRS